MALTQTAYLQLLDWSGRLLRPEKRGAIPGESSPLLSRLGISKEGWLRFTTPVFVFPVLMKELQDRLRDRGWTLEWKQVCDDLDQLQKQTLSISGKRSRIHTAATDAAGKVLQAAGVALGPSVRLLE